MADERWLFIEGLRPTDVLKTLKVPYLSQVIKSPTESEGIAFPEKFKDHIFYVYGINPYAVIKYWDTNIPNVQMIRNEYNSEKFAINALSPDQIDLEVIKGFDNPILIKKLPTLESADNMECWGTLQPIIAKFISELNVEAIVSNPHGIAFPVMSNPNTLYFRFWSTPFVEGGNAYHIKKVCGIPVSEGQQDAFRSSGDGITVRDSDGNEVVQVYGTTIYILFDLPHGSTSNERVPKMFASILNLIRPLVDTLEKREELSRNIKHVSLEKSKERYVKECMKRQVQRKNELENEISEQISLQKRYADALHTAIRREQESKRQLDFVAVDDDKINRLFAIEFDKLIKVNKVAQVTVDRGYISIVTDFLYTQKLRDDSIRELGVFKIDIPVNGGNPKIYNLTKTIKRLFHPHDNGHNTLCLGNITDGLVKLMASFEFSIVTQILIEFLQTINEDDSYGKRVYEWPTFDVKKAEQEKIEHAAKLAGEPKKKAVRKTVKTPKTEVDKEASA